MRWDFHCWVSVELEDMASTYSIPVPNLEATIECLERQQTPQKGMVMPMI